MKLKKLLKNVPYSECKGSKDIEIYGITSHSKTVGPGYLFIAKKGRRSNGVDFIPDAILAGAVAVVTDMYNPFQKELTQIICEDVALVESLLAKEFYKDPSSELFLAGITGTNGKTTTSYFLKYLLEEVGPCGLIGTIETITGAHRFESSLTTPEIVTTNKLLKEMVQSGCKSAVMEVSSIGVDQGRVADLDFDLAIFTNLTEEHLDYHETMQQYSVAKQRFLQTFGRATSRKNKEKVALINLDSPWAKVMQEECCGKVVTYSLHSPNADFFARIIESDLTKSLFELHFQGKQYLMEFPFMGEHNVYNALAAVAGAFQGGVPLEVIVEKMPHIPQVPGRLERIACESAGTVFVDYAHTPHGLENVLKALRKENPKRLILVFGCGGDRDREKRPVMAKIAELYADEIIVTSDNPRSEPPHKIIEEIVQGFSREKHYFIKESRKDAIAKAIGMAERGDVVLIAGKGHETCQIIGLAAHEFDDRLIAKSVLVN